jgi:hypothetical protein
VLLVALLLQGVVDEGDGVADGAKVLDLLVGDRDVELLFGVDDDGHHRDGVDVEVVGERLVELDALGRDARLVVDDLGETCQNFFSVETHELLLLARWIGGHVRYYVSGRW